MKDNFKKDVSESLKRLHFVLLKKAKSKKLSPWQFQKCMEYLNFLQIVASNAGAYCNPEYFVRNVQKLGFDVATDFNLLNVDEFAAQSVYDIMVCRRDYIFLGDEKLRKTRKFGPCKYDSRQDAIDAMRLFKRDSVQMAGGIIPCMVRKVWNSVCGKNK